MKDRVLAPEINDRHVLIDVRTPNEYAGENIAGSQNIPLGDLERECQKLADQQNLVLVCASGMRAQKAQDLLRSKGIQASVLDGGIRDWNRCSLPTVRGQSQGISLERQVRIVAGALVALGSLLALTVDPRFALLSGFVGCGLVFAGVTDTCGMAILLAQLPYNKSQKKCGRC